MSESSQIPVISNRYEPMNTIGEGGMGKVLKCYDTRLDREVAVKLLAKGVETSRLQRFQEEARLSARLNHPNIAQTIDFGVTKEEQPFLVMEFVDGESLASRLAREGVLDVDVAIEILIALCEGLAHAHKHNIWHRDVKPSNVILADEDDEILVKLVDFGIAKSIHDEQRLTHTGALVGSPGYISPEAASGDTTDNRSDIYSLGCLAFEILTGQLPFVNETDVETILSHINQPAPALEDRLSNDFSKQLEAVVSKCLRKEPDERFQSATELKAALELVLTALRDKQELSVEPTSSESVSNSTSNGRSILAIATAGGALLMACSVYYLFSQNGEKSTRKQSLDMAFAPPVSNEADRAHFVDKGGTLEVRAAGLLSDEDLKGIAKEHPDIKKIALENQRISARGLENLVGTRLQDIDLRRCLIDDEAVEVLSRFNHLIHVNLAYCPDISGSSIKQLVERRKLTGISLGGPGDTQKKLSALEGQDSIRFLRLYDMRKEDWQELPYLPNLRNMTLIKTTPDRHFMGQLTKKAPALLDFWFEHCVFETGILDELSTLPFLQRLTIKYTTMTPEQLRSLGKCRRLEFINLDTVGEPSDAFRANLVLTRQQMSAISALPVKALMLTYNTIPAESLEQLKTMTHLEQLTLQNCRVHEKDIWKLRSALKNCNFNLQRNREPD